MPTKFGVVYGVDFSGARLAGRNTWIARIVPAGRRAGAGRYVLTELARLEDLCGTAERSTALRFLVGLIARSEGALWALDFPFGLPVELMDGGAVWRSQFDFLREWGEDGYGCGLECVSRSRRLLGVKHIRRLTDLEERAPFDPYHYRIIYQTFHGMREVLEPLLRRRHTAILPFHYRRLTRARRVLVEACPASTLKRLNLPHQNYKQPAGGRLTRKRLVNRRAILEGLAEHVSVDCGLRRRIMRDGGADALDALIAAVGAARSFRHTDHASVSRHPRYTREGRLYV